MGDSVPGEFTSEREMFVRKLQNAIGCYDSERDATRSFFLSFQVQTFSNNYFHPEFRAKVYRGEKIILSLKGLCRETIKKYEGYWMKDRNREPIAEYVDLAAVKMKGLINSSLCYRDALIMLPSSTGIGEYDDYVDIRKLKGILKLSYDKLYHSFLTFYPWVLQYINGEFEPFYHPKCSSYNRRNLIFGHDETRMFLRCFGVFNQDDEQSAMMTDLGVRGLVGGRQFGSSTGVSVGDQSPPRDPCIPRNAVS
eukprot:565963-Hanusia_phi.AAC.1